VKAGPVVGTWFISPVLVHLSKPSGWWVFKVVNCTKETFSIVKKVTQPVIAMRTKQPSYFLRLVVVIHMDCLFNIKNYRTSRITTLISLLLKKALKVLW
jgi:hypothetical protein